MEVFDAAQGENWGSRRKEGVENEPGVVKRRRRCHGDAWRDPWKYRGISRVEVEIPKPKLGKCPVKPRILKPRSIYGPVVPERGARGVNKGVLK